MRETWQTRSLERSGPSPACGALGRPSTHLVRAFSRYQSDTGDRLAAAVTYFGLSFFPLIALAFAVLGYLVAYQPTIRDQVTSQLTQNFPGLIGGPNGINVDQIAAAKAGAGIIGLLGLLYSGLGWPMPCGRRSAPSGTRT